jgi:hypothetical protein
MASAMSSSQQPGVLGRVLGSMLPETGPDYQCRVCGLSYDTERLNCHACGGPVEEPSAHQC